jgi:hypothetical protein
MQMACKIIASAHELIGEVMRDYSSWQTQSTPWFRGEPRDTATPLLPRLFRPEEGRKHEELKLLQHFRMKAPSLGLPYIPPREYTDQWLFLAQHVRLPTRLLDWTAGLLIALHFAVHTREGGAVVWMLDPDGLNRKSFGSFKDGDYALTWFSQKRRPLAAEDLFTIQKMIKDGGEGYLEGIDENVGNLNIHKAWTQKVKGTPYPFALHPTNVHPRMSSQASRFTIHGEMEESMCRMALGDRILRKYSIADEAIPHVRDELRMMGITHSSLFPELDGLSDELSEVY